MMDITELELKQDEIVIYKDGAPKYIFNKKLKKIVKNLTRINKEDAPVPLDTQCRNHLMENAKKSCSGKKYFYK